MSSSSLRQSSRFEIASWIFGSIFAVFILGVFILGPDQLPQYKHRILSITSASMAGFLGFFLTGAVTLNWTANVPAMGKLAIRAGGGLALFVLVLLWWNSHFSPIKAATLSEVSELLVAVSGKYQGQISDLSRKLSLSEEETERLRKDLESAIRRAEAAEKAGDPKGGRALEEIRRSGNPELLLDFLEAGRERNLHEVVKLDFEISSIALYTGNMAKAKAACERILGAEPENLDALFMLARIHWTLGDHTRMEHLLLKAAPIAEAQKRQDYLAGAYGGLGVAYKETGDFAKAKELHLRALAINTSVGNKEGVARDLVNLGIAYEELEEVSNAKDSYEAALKIQGEIEKPPRQGVAIASGSLGLLYVRQGDREKAEPLLTNAHEILLGFGSEMEISRSFNHLGYLYEDSPDKSRAYYYQALAIAERINYKLGILLNVKSLAKSYFKEGNDDKAEELFRKASNLSEEIGSAWERASTYYNFGLFYLGRRELDKAKGLLEKASQLGEEMGNVRFLAKVNDQMGTLFRAQGNLEKAASCYMKILEINTPMPVFEEKVEYYDTIGRYYESRNEYDRAEKAHLTALSLSSKCGNEQGMQTAHAFLGTVYIQMGQLIKGRDSFLASLALAEKLKNRERAATLSYGIGTVSLMLKNFDDARKYLNRAEDLYAQLMMDKELDMVRSTMKSLPK